MDISHTVLLNLTFMLLVSLKPPIVGVTVFFENMNLGFDKKIPFEDLWE